MLKFSTISLCPLCEHNIIYAEDQYYINFEADESKILPVCRICLKLPEDKHVVLLKKMLPDPTKWCELNSSRLIYQAGIMSQPIDLEILAQVKNIKPDIPENNTYSFFLAGVKSIVKIMLVPLILGALPMLTEPILKQFLPGVKSSQQDYSRMHP